MRKQAMFTFLALLVSLSSPATADTTQKPEPIMILDLSSYTAGAAFATPTRQGFDMAEEEINAAGGVLERPIHFEHVDDTGKPEQAITKAQQFLLQDKPVLITGCALENIDLAISSFAKHNKVLHVYGCVGSDEAVWQKGHRYSFRGIGPTLYSYNKILAERAATKHKVKWAAVNFNYAWGQENFSAFKESLAHYEPNAEWKEEQWVPVSKIDAGSVVNAILRSGADAVYTSLWGSDLTQFLLEANKRGLADKVLIVGDIGRPEFMEQMKNNLPVGMITLGTLPYEYPVTPEMKTFAERYQARYHQATRYTALQSYVTAKLIAAAIARAGSTETEALINTLSGLQLNSLFGPMTVRSVDHVPDNGIWVGETALKDGMPILVNVEYKSGKDYFPSDVYIQNLRKP